MQSRAKGWRKRQAVQFCKLGCLPFYYPSLDGIRFVCSGVGGSPLIILFVCLGNVLLEGNGEDAESSVSAVVHLFGWASRVPG